MFAILKLKAYNFSARRSFLTNHKDICSFLINKFFFNNIKKYYSFRKNKFNAISWSSFNFSWCFYGFRFKAKGNKIKFYFGSSEVIENVLKKLTNIKNSCFMGHLVLLIKFENEKNLFFFKKFITKELAKISKPLQNILVYKLEGFAFVTNEQINSIILDAYYSGLYSGTLCPFEHIEHFNKK